MKIELTHRMKVLEKFIERRTFSRNKDELKLPKR